MSLYLYICLSSPSVSLSSNPRNPFLSQEHYLTPRVLPGQGETVEADPGPPGAHEAGRDQDRHEDGRHPPASRGRS